MESYIVVGAIIGVLVIVYLVVTARQARDKDRRPDGR